MLYYDEQNNTTTSKPKRPGVYYPCRPSKESFPPDVSQETLKQHGFYPTQDVKSSYNPDAEKVIPTGWTKDGDVYIRQYEIQPIYKVDISLDKEVITADGQDTVTITVQLFLGSSLSSDFDGQTWYVPITGVDGVQQDLLTFAYAGGEATVTWSTDRKGIYTIRLDMIRPKNNANLNNSPEVIAI